MPTYAYSHGPRQAAPVDRAGAAREAFGRLVEQLVEQGEYALNALRRDGPEGSEAVRQLVRAGYLAVSEQGRLELTELALRGVEERVLRELFRAHGGALSGWHAGAAGGQGAVPGDEVRPLAPGEPLGQVDLSLTLSEASRRGWPLQVREEDVHVRDGEASGRCACVLLLDLSGSMARLGKFTAARRAALALRALVRKQFPGDELHAAGFATRAVRLEGRALVEALPRSVGLFDPHQGPVRLPADAEEVPEHFTNIQAGLRLARRLLRCRAHAARQVLLVTDGEPTACLDGDDLVLAYPPTEQVLGATLREAARCASEGIALGVFGLVGEFSAPGLGPYLQALAAAGKGVSVLCGARHLAPNMVQRFVWMRDVRGR